MNDLPPKISNDTTAPARKARKTRAVFAIIVAVLVALGALGYTTLLGMAALLGEDDGEPLKLKEKRMTGGDADAGDKIAVIYVRDLISFMAPGYMGEEGMVGDIKEALDKATKDKKVKAIILAIDSPGGEVTASDVIHHAVLGAKKSGKPIVASMGPLAASGAYYVAVGADWIVAHPTTLTGSIGVIFSLWNYRGLMDKLGVKPMVWKSGKMKDMLSPTKADSEITPEERRIVERLVMTDYDRFVSAVAEGRKMKVEALKTGLADGRVLSGVEALEHKFVDQLGYFEDAVAKAKSLAKIEQAKLVKYEAPFSLRKLLGLFMNSRASSLRIQMTPDDFELQTGRLYYLPPAWMR